MGAFGGAHDPITCSATSGVKLPQEDPQTELRALQGLAAFRDAARAHQAGQQGAVDDQNIQLEAGLSLNMDTWAMSAALLMR